MINNADITIFSQRVGNDRREVFYPTMISSVCWYDVRSMVQSERDRNGGSKFIIRIPYDADIQDNRKYLPEDKYNALPISELDKYWTIQKNAYIIKEQYVNAADWKFDDFSFRSGIITGLTMENIEILRQKVEDFVTVVEYADNTVRGSDRVKHWRIGGA